MPEKPRDLFMQFAEVEVTLGVASNVLAEGQLDTNLSVRGGFLWLIHMVEFTIRGAGLSAQGDFNIALCTQAGLAVIPDYADNGLIAMATWSLRGAVAAGMSAQGSPKRQEFLPPIPLAAPRISLYAITSSDDAGFQAKTPQCRIGFTTAPLDAKSYIEIAETWGY